MGNGTLWNHLVSGHGNDPEDLIRSWSSSGSRYQRTPQVRDHSTIVCCWTARYKAETKRLDKRMREENSSGGPSWKASLYAVIIFSSVALALTLLGILLGPAQTQVGGVRPDDTIPEHLAELAAFGLLLGLGSMALYGTRGLPLVLLTPTLTVLLDIDHLPAYLGYTEPIRPAHSIVFIFLTLTVTAITIKALDMELVVASAFMGHLAVDTGLFAPFSPISFQYLQLDPYRPLFAVGAVACALAAGVAFRRKQMLSEAGGKDA
jgi:hypothetical protein